VRAERLAKSGNTEEVKANSNGEIHVNGNREAKLNGNGVKNVDVNTDAKPNGGKET